MSALPHVLPGSRGPVGVAERSAQPAAAADSSRPQRNFPLMFELSTTPALAYPVPDGSAQGLAGLQVASRLLRDRHFAELTHDLLCAVGFDGCFKFVSRSWEAAAGYGADELDAAPLARFIHPDDAETLEALHDVAAGNDNGPVRFQSRFRCKDGSYRWLSWNARAVFEQGLIYVAARDVTAERAAEARLEVALARVAEGQRSLRETAAELEQAKAALTRLQLQLIQAEKLDAIGRLAAGIAHEVKNPLAVVLMGIDILSREPGGHAGRATEVLSTMRHAAVRAEAIVRGFVNLSAPTELKVKLQDLNRVVEESLLMVKHALTAGHIDPTVSLAAGLPPVALDGPKIEQVLINIFLNAAQSMGKARGGKLTVRTSLRQLTEPPPGAAGPGQPGDLGAGDAVVAVEVEDNGPGIEPETLARLFEPFFTTKPAGQGTGLGLAVSRQIMHLHGGAFFIENRPEGGARATVLFKA